MWLEQIREPGDLRDLSYDELAALAGEIRDFIVAAVAENAGHLGSNLGVVELTLALHRVFDSPHDALLWDTGHQAYVHKLVTGRQAGFARLRQTGGLCGYPSRAESPHDFVENSHASTILSYAYGLAVARDLGAADHRHVVAVIGDGSMTGGMAYEALNNLGHSGKRVIIILNDNGRSYAPTISNLTADRTAAADGPETAPIISRIGDVLSHFLTDIRLNPVYVRRQRKLEELVRDVPLVGYPAERAVEAVKAAARELLQPPSFFEALGVRYVGPIDGHDLAALEPALRNAIELSAEGPIVVHVAHPEGPRLPAGRGRRREAPPRRARVRSGDRSAQGGPDRLHADVRRDGHQAGRGRRPDRRDHRGDGRTDRAAAVRGALPRPLLRRRHRRAARRHGRGRDGDGRDAPDRGDLLDVPQPSVGPGRLRRRAAPPAGRVLHRSSRDHRSGRPEPPRRVRHGDARQGAGDARPRPVERPGAAGDDGRRRRRSPTTARSRSATRVAAPARSTSTRSAPASPPAAIRQARRPGRARPASSPSASSSPPPNGPPPSSPRSGVDVTVWDARCCAPLDPAMLADAARHERSSRPRTASATAGSGRRSRRASASWHRPSSTRSLGLPTRFIPHAGTPDEILAALGLDHAGIAAAVRLPHVHDPMA